jgi:hypothetical protein
MTQTHPDTWQVSRMAKQKFFGIKVSKPNIPVQQASDRQLIYKDNFSTKVFYDNQNSRIVQGLLPDNQYGMWVSKPGDNADAKDAALLNNLIFNSNNDIFRIEDIQSTTIDIPAYTFIASYSYTQTYPHNLGYVPTILIYFELTPNTYQGPINTFGVAGSTTQDFTFDWYSYDVDSINLYVTFNQFRWGIDPTRYSPINFSAYSIPIKYFLLQNTLS